MHISTLAHYREPDCSEEQRREIERYIDDIPDPQTREMFRLHFIDGLSYAKTAAELGGGMGRMCVFHRVHRYKPRRKVGDSL